MDYEKLWNELKEQLENLRAGERYWLDRGYDSARGIALHDAYSLTLQYMLKKEELAQEREKKQC